MLIQYQALLKLAIKELCEKMDPLKVMSELLKHDLFDKSDLELVMHPTTTWEKNDKLVNILLREEFNTFSEFLRSLSSIDKEHLALAEAIQPVRFRILWFSISPIQAAAVVHTLEKYAEASFSKMQRIGKNNLLILRRGRAFKTEYSRNELSKDMDAQELVKYSHDVEVCLIFPSFTSDPITSLETCFKECLISKPNLLVMGGICEVSGQGGHSFVITQATDVQGVCVKPTSYDLVLSVFPQIRDAKSTCIDQATDHLCHHLGSLQIEPCLMQEFSDQATCNSSSNSSPEFDLTTFNFYTLCQQYFPETRSLVCLGNAPSLANAGASKPAKGVKPMGECDQGVESAAVTSSRALMNIIKYYYKNE